MFDANAGGPGSGATYTPPQLIFGAGVTTTEPAEPSRPGYKFLGWNTETDGTGDWWGTYYTISAEGEKIPHEGTQQFGSVLKNDVNLYAQWEGDETSYYIIFWKQKADATGTDKENDYDYAESVVRTAKTGETVSLINADRQKGGTGDSDYGYFFTFNGNNSDVTATVNANGDTHLNVYYDRREITYIFKYGNNYEKKTISGYDLAKIGNNYAIKINGEWHKITVYGYYVWNASSITNVSSNRTISYIWEGYSYSDARYDNNVYSFKEDESYTGLYGSAFTQWPDAGSGKTWYDGYYFYPLAVTVFDPSVTGTTNPEGTTISFSVFNYDSSSNQLFVYGQKVDGSWKYTSDEYLCPPAKPGKDGTWYPTETFTGYTINGYQVGYSINTSESAWSSANPDTGIDYDRTNIYLRYSRNQYKITYVSEGDGTNGRQEHSEEGIYYDTVLTGFENKYIPKNGRDGYAFVGWYADKDCQIPFDFTGRMGASDVTVYAKWETQRARVVLIPNAPEGQYSFANNQSLSFRLNYNEKVDGKNITGTAVKRTGYTLAGWYVTVDGQDYLWNFDTPVNNTVRGVNKDYQKTEDWENNTYGDNDGKHENVVNILKLKAKWRLNVEDNSVYIIYQVPDAYIVRNADGNLQTVIPVDDTAYLLKEGATSIGFTTAQAPTEYNDGYAFKDWALLDENGAKSGTTYKDGATVEAVDQEYFRTVTVTDDEGNSRTIRYIYLEAEFEPFEDRATAVIFDGQGGITSDGKSTVEESYVVNKKFDIIENPFEREGYEFVEWNTSPDGTGTALAAGTSVAADNRAGAGWSTEGEQNIVYAIWKTKLYINVEGSEDTKVYNGSEQENNAYTVTVKASADGVHFVNVPASLYSLMGISVNVTGSGNNGGGTAAKAVGTNVGNYTTSVTATLTSSFPALYEIGVGSASDDVVLHITKNNLTITANDQKYTYNGQAQGENNATYTDASKVTVAGLQGSDALTSIKLNGQETNVGEYAGKIVPSEAAIGEATGNYEISYVPGKLTITKAKLTVTAEDKNKEYGAADPALTWKVDGLKNGDTKDILTVAIARASGENVGHYEITPSGEEEIANYTIEYVKGDFEIKPISVTVTLHGNTSSVDYDGADHTITGYTVDSISSDLYTANDFQLKEGKEATATRKDQGKTMMDLTGDDFENLNANFSEVTFNYTDGYQEIKPADISDTTKFTVSDPANTMYNGEEQKQPVTVTFGETKLVEGTDFDITYSENVTDVGTVTVTVTGKGNYTGKVEKTYKITPRPVTVSVQNAPNVVYDGEEHTGETEYTFDNVVAGQTATITYTPAKGRLVGTYTGTYGEDFKVMAGTKDVTANYELTDKTPGNLTITDGTGDDEEDVPDDKVVTKDDGNKGPYKLGDTVEWIVTVTNIYNETKKLQVTEAASMTIKSEVPETLAAGETVTITVEHVVTAADVAAGSIKNEVTVKIGDLEKKGEDTVYTNQIQITITAASASKVYDGDALTNDDYELTSGELNTGDKIDSVTVTGSQTLVGSSANVASAAKIVDAKGADVTAGYKVTYADGTLTVTDGTNPGETEVPDDKVVTKTDNSDKTYKLGETIEWTVKVKNIYDAEKSLTVTEAEGMTIVDTVPATLKAGEEIAIRVRHVVTAADVAAGNIRNEVAVKIGDLEKKGDDTVETEPIQITITAASASKVYDGTVLTNNGYEVTSGALNTGDKFDSVTVTGTQTLVGSSANVASAAKITDAAGNDVTAGYKVTYAEGLLTVTDGTSPAETDVPDNLVVTKDDGRNTTYRMGDTVTWTVNVKNIYDETKTLTVTEAPGMTIVGTVPATLTAGQEIQIRVQHVVTAADAAAGNIKNEVTVKIGDLEKKGEDTVTTAQIPITVTAASATKEYDGTALTNDGYTLTSGLLSNGHTIQSITVTGSQTEVGSSANVASGMVITDAAGNNVTAGYAITYANGTLTVTEQQNQGGQNFTLTIRYWMDGRVISTVRRNGANGTAFDVATPPIEGYTPDRERVSGTLTANTEYDVVYTVNEYTLTIRYVYPNGEPATDPFVGGFLFGEDYSIPAPMIPGLYTANRLVTGTMPARDVTVTVIFAEAENLIHIDDFETPLGLGLGSINAGETIE